MDEDKKKNGCCDSQKSDESCCKDSGKAKDESCCNDEAKTEQKAGKSCCCGH